MTGRRWDRLNEIFYAAANAPPGEREAVVARLCTGDTELLQQVARLLSAHDASDRFLEQPAFATAGPGADLKPIRDGQRLGPYRIVRRIARGGMGAVYLGERADGHYEQRVAIKLARRSFDSEMLLQRFRAERQILAALQHPNIARLLDGGTSEEGEPYFVMEYIDGVPLTAYAEQRDLSTCERLRLFLTVCEAVGYAHGQHVIHRDIKPANILVTADGVARLLDFGIAKAFDACPMGAPTQTGMQLLTPEYASPEQIEGRTATVQSDVYSLGVVLYELLTGSSPYGTLAAHPLRVAETVRTTAPRPPSSMARDASVRRALRGDLDTVILKAIRKEQERRYSSVQEFAADVVQYLEGRPVRARRDSIGYRTSRFARRNRATLIAAGLTAAVLLGTGLLAFTAVAGLAATSASPTPLSNRSSLVGEGAGPVVIGPVQNAGAAHGKMGAISLEEGDSIARIVPLILADALARVSGAKIVDRLRLLELHAERSTSPDDAGATREIARAADARSLIEGVLFRDPRAGYRLNVRITRLTEAVDAKHSLDVYGRDAAELAHGVARALLGTTRSVVDEDMARRRQWGLRDSGQRHLARGEPRPAHDLFALAVARDTTDAAAWYYAQQALDAVDSHAPRAFLRRALGHSGNATPAERLWIRIEWSSAMGEPSLSVLTDSLLQLEPVNPRVLRTWASARANRGDFDAAIPKLWAAFRLDDIGRTRERSSQICLACSTLEQLVGVYSAADAGAGALNAARLLVARQPHVVRHWLSLATLASRAGNDAEAAAAIARAYEVAPGEEYTIGLHEAVATVEQGRYDLAEKQLARLLHRVRSAEERYEVLWWRAIILRQQGRFETALRTLQSVRPAASNPALREVHLLHEGQIHFEIGNLTSAAAAFDSAAQITRLLRDSPAVFAANRGWRLMHVARTRAEMGDTAELSRLTDSVRNFGGMNEWGRNARLHYYLQAKMLVARGDTAAAVTAYRASMFSTAFGFTRANYEAARLLVATGRPAEAIPLLAAALRGGRDASNLYITATELHGLLATAYEMIDRPALAAAHHRAVANAWNAADSPWRVQAAYARQRSAELARQ